MAYNIQHMSIDQKTKQIIIDYFAGKPEVATVYLYGSQARGDARPDSDIDLGVLMIDKKNFYHYDSDLSSLTKREVEIQDLHECRVDFAHRVLCKGNLLLSNNEKARVDFEEKIFRNYFDMKPFLDEYYKSLSEITKRGELHVRYI